ncbi:hypothetical protein [Nesterenkonia populi]
MADYITLSKQIREHQEKLEQLRTERAGLICQAVAEGTSAYRIARECGISQTAIHRIVKEGKNG